MTPDEDIGAALDLMRDKSRALNDSLKVLAEEGFSQLEKSTAQAVAPRSSNRKESGGDESAQLAKLLQQEISSGIAGLFGMRGKDSGLSGGMSGGITVTVNNNSTAAVSVQESGGGAFDQKYLEITIDQMVANSLMGGRQTSGVMRTLFGLAPSLIGR